MLVNEMTDEETRRWVRARILEACIEATEEPCIEATEELRHVRQEEAEADEYDEREDR